MPRGATCRGAADRVKKETPTGCGGLYGHCHCRHCVWSKCGPAGSPLNNEEGLSLARDNFKAGSGPGACEWQVLAERVRHTFTHFHLELGVVRGSVEGDASLEEGLWCPEAELGQRALPSLMTKVARLVTHGNIREKTGS